MKVVHKQIGRYCDLICTFANEMNTSIGKSPRSEFFSDINVTR